METTLFLKPLSNVDRLHLIFLDERESQELCILRSLPHLLCQAVGGRGGGRVAQFTFQTCIICIAILCKYKWTMNTHTLRHYGLFLAYIYMYTHHISVLGPTHTGGRPAICAYWVDHTQAHIVQ